MNQNDIKAIAENALMIIDGYAFSKPEGQGDNISIVNLHAPNHALVMTRNGEVLETTMDDIEISIVQTYWSENKQFAEEAYA